VLPDVNAAGVILQGAVIVTFDQEIDVTTYDESSFLLSAPRLAVRPIVSERGVSGNRSLTSPRGFDVVPWFY